MRVEERREAARIAVATNGQVGVRRRPSVARGTAFSLARDAVLLLVSYWIALALRFDLRIPDDFVWRLLLLSPVVAGLPVLAGLWRGVYRMIPEYASIGELLRLAEAMAASTAAVLLLVAFAPSAAHLLPLSVPVMAGLIGFVSLGAVRFTARLRGYVRSGRAGAADAERVLIVGAGAAGEMIARDMMRNPASKFTPVGFLDDDPVKRGRRLHGIQVLGSTDDLPEAVHRTNANHVVIAMPSAPSRVIRRVLDYVGETSAKPKILPGLSSLMSTRVTTADVRNVDISDLIGREPVQINTDEICHYIRGRTVVVTGAAGSIGSELARQLVRFSPGRLVLLDNDESDLYWLASELSERGGAPPLQTVIADIRDYPRVIKVFDDVLPDVVFHAAAHKHVPLMEQHPEEAVTTNIAGTRHVAEAAARVGVDRFVLVSTDKAVDPISVMGATKRVAEMITRSIGESSSTIFASVRFGNVLGSRGSVVPLFERQIKDGGPMTVTHPDATRYFMTIPEAAALIVQAGAFAKGGETFVLDIGEPVRIVDLAERMRDLLTDGSRDIDITFTGLRPGEKLEETLWDSSHSLLPSQHPQIRVSLENGHGRNGFAKEVQAAESLAFELADPELVRRALFGILNHN